MSECSGDFYQSHGYFINSAYRGVQLICKLQRLMLSPIFLILSLHLLLSPLVLSAWFIILFQFYQWLCRPCCYRYVFVFSLRGSILCMCPCLCFAFNVFCCLWNALKFCVLICFSANYYCLSCFVRRHLFKLLLLCFLSCSICFFVLWKLIKSI